jgi:Xaa-Pro aminopeptidase
VTRASGWPRLSLAERARRFTAVRERMRRRGLDVLVVRADSGKWDSGSAEARYLTHIGGNGEEGYVVFDVAQNPVYVTLGPGQIENWREAQDWTTDLRPPAPTPAEAVAARVRELGRERGPIGVVGRVPGPLTPEGRWPQVAWEALGRALPAASLVDFDEDLAIVRAVKSAEEIACHERAMQIAEAAIDALYASARPGVRAIDVQGRILGTLVGGGSDLTLQLMFGAAERTTVAARLAPHRPLAPGDVILSEITGRYAGYSSQAHVAVALGDPSPACRRLMALVTEALERGAKALRPGVTAGELAQALRAPILESGCGNLMPVFKGIGLAAAEFPMSPPVGATAGPTPVRIAQDMVMTLEPSAWDPGAKVGVHLAETYVVTAGGCRRLGRRELGLHLA